MKRVVHRLSIGAMLCWLPGSVPAATLTANCAVATFNYIVGLPSSLSCPQFQAGGTLQSVQITVSGSLQDGGSVTNNAPGAQTFLLREVTSFNFGPLPGFNLSGFTQTNPALVVNNSMNATLLTTGSSVAINLVPDDYNSGSLGSATTILGGYAGAGTFAVPIAMDLAQTSMTAIGAPVTSLLALTGSNPVTQVSATVTYTSSLSPYRVTYDRNRSTLGGPPTDAATYAVGATVTVLGNSGLLSKTGSTFAGWNSAADGHGTRYAPGATFNIGAADLRLYARWSPNVCTLDLDDNGSVDALTDGLMLLRAMLGLTGTTVTNGAIGGGTPTRTTWAQIQPYLNGNCGTNFAQ